MGAEVSLIEDLMDPNVQLGEMGLMFTTLKVALHRHTNTKRITSFVLLAVFYTDQKSNFSYLDLVEMVLCALLVLLVFIYT